MTNKIIEQILSFEIVIASSLIFITILMIMTFFFKWIALVLAVVFGIASFGYIRQIMSKK